MSADKYHVHEFVQKNDSSGKTKGYSERKLAEIYIKAYPDCGLKLATVRTFIGRSRRNQIGDRTEEFNPSQIATGTDNPLLPTHDEVTEDNVRKVVQSDIAKARTAAKLREAEFKYKHVLRELEEADKRFDALIQIKEEVTIHQIDPVLSQSKHEAIPVIMLSDWHFEERVDDFTINGLNHYNLEIASKRWVTCIQGSLKLVNKERLSSDISQAVVWLGGDFITGYIHEELEENNYLSPTQATRFAKEKIITALKFYLEHGKFKKITVVCNYGNHGRTNKKPRISSAYKNSYEWMMYQDIRDYFSNENRLDFVSPSGMFAYVNIMQLTCRFFHGENIKFGGGIGGLTVPLIKAIHRLNIQLPADYNFMGHFHQYWEATKDCTVNGSGIGFNAYAQSIGASCEPPVQGFRLVDSKYGMTTKLPIFCE